MYKVLYRTSRGFLTSGLRGRKKPIFPIQSDKGLKIGLVEVLDNTLVDKGKFCFAHMRNVVGVLPESYFTVDFFENIGVPIKVYKGTYGDSIFVKEVYKDRTLIRALDTQGLTLLQERDKNKHQESNVYFHRLNEAVTDWQDITGTFVTRVLATLSAKDANISFDNSSILFAVQRLWRNKFIIGENGVVYIQGKFETLAIWGTPEVPHMAWMGRVIPAKGTILSFDKFLKPKLEQHNMTHIRGNYADN